MAGSEAVSKLQRPGIWGDLEAVGVAVQESESSPTGRRTS
ncbi:dynein light chain Tctex-type 4 [Prionailurus iriomotensis]